MVIKTTRWSPDTCDCVLEYSWDDSLPQNRITISPKKIVEKCSFHQSLASDSEVWSTVMEENPRKNIAFQHILDNGPSSLYKLQDDGKTRVIKPKLNYNISWSGTAPNRIMTISFPDITLDTAQKSAIQTALNKKFGADKVVIG